MGNRRGRACLVFGGAGLAVSDTYDFKGNPLAASRRVSAVVEDEPDWSVVASSATPSAALRTVTMTRTLYGESYPEPEVGNRRGRACLVFDGAGLAVSDSYDFKGNPLAASRRVSALSLDGIAGSGHFATRYTAPFSYSELLPSVIQ